MSPTKSMSPLSRPQHEKLLYRHIRQSSGSLEAGARAYDGVRLFVRYRDTNTCPCGVHFHFPSPSSAEQLAKAVKLHVDTEHQGAHLWDVKSVAQENVQFDLVYLSKLYPGARVTAYERWEPPNGYFGPTNVARPKSSFDRNNSSQMNAPPTPPYSSTSSSSSSSGSQRSLRSRIQLRTPNPRQRENSRSSYNATGRNKSGPSSPHSHDSSPAERPVVIDSDAWRCFDPNALFCLCRQPADGTYMVGCDECDDWFHPACVGKSVLEVMQLGRAAYYCPRCTQAFRNETHNIKSETIKVEDEEPTVPPPYKRTLQTSKRARSETYLSSDDERDVEMKLEENETEESFVQKQAEDGEEKRPGYEIGCWPKGRTQ